MKKAFDSIKRGLTQAIAHQKGNAQSVKIHAPVEVDVQALRKRIGLSQQEFAAKFSISLGTLRHWERGDRKPHGPAEGHRPRGWCGIARSAVARTEATPETCSGRIPAAFTNEGSDDSAGRDRRSVASSIAYTAPYPIR